MRAPVPPPPPPPRSPKLMAMSRQELVDLFEKLSIAQGEAYAYFETAKANRYFRRRRAVVSELRHRETDERPALYALYSHRHPWVRMSVATSTYALNPERAKAVLAEIAATRLEPWRSNAGMSLALLANGMSQLPFDRG
jgi:Domain of unknown function (DUF2019)